MPFSQVAVVPVLSKVIANAGASLLLSVSVPEFENVGRLILMKLAPEVGLIEIFQKRTSPLTKMVSVSGRHTVLARA